MGNSNTNYTMGNSNTNYTPVAAQNTATNLFTYTISTTEKEPEMLDVPAFVQIDLLNQTRLSGRFERYSDPTGVNAYGAFVGEGMDGSKHYVLWAAISQITVFPLTAQNPTTPAPEPIKDAPQS